VKRLLLVVTLAILLLGLMLVGLSDTNTAANTSVYYIETYLEPHEASNSSASATITIAMYTEGE
jgi:hypothetical protein